MNTEESNLTERVQEFELCDIAQFIRDDIAAAIEARTLPNRLSGRKYSVRVIKNNQPVIRVLVPSAILAHGEKNALHEIARAYQRLTWNDATQNMKPNFKFEIKYGTE